jgi:hypothetical protein
VDGAVAVIPFAGPPRWIRGWTVGAVAVGLSAAGHAVAGGAAPGPASLTVLTVGAALPCVALSTVEWTLRRLTGVLLIVQGLLHLAFLAGATHHHVSGSPSAMIAWHVVATAASVAIIRYAEGMLVGTAGRSALRRALRLTEHALGLPVASRPLLSVAAPGTSPSRLPAHVSARGPPPACS